MMLFMMLLFILKVYIFSALEAELRGLRKGAVELEEQNAVLSSHIAELNNVVMELRNAKLMMQVRIIWLYRCIYLTYRSVKVLLNKRGICIY